MTEPKVVRWTRPGTVTALRIKAGRFECRWDHYPNAGDHRWKDCGPVSIAVTDELARLAARVQELESLEYRECRNAALEEAAVRVGREIVWAEYAEQEAYEESDHVVGAAMCKLTPKLYELMDTIRALKEKP